MSADPHAGAAGPDGAANADSSAAVSEIDVSAAETVTGAEQFEEFLDDAPASAAGARPVVGADDATVAEAPSGTPDSPAPGQLGDTDSPVDADASADANVDTDANADTDADVGDPRIAELVAARDELKDIAQRVQAEYENYRKQSAARLAADVERATGAFAEALLPVLDAAEAAYVTHPDEVGPLFNLLLGELRKRGLEQLDLLGQPFDPNLADAVAHEPGDGGEPRVAEVLRSGYTWKGKTLRAAMVRTAD